MNFKCVGTWWNDRDVELVEFNGKVYALNKWDGEEWTDCWECVGEYHMDIGETGIRIRPVYEEVAEDEFEVVKYERLI